MMCVAIGTLGLFVILIPRAFAAAGHQNNLKRLLRKDTAIQINADSLAASYVLHHKTLVQPPMQRTVSDENENEERVLSDQKGREGVDHPLWTPPRLCRDDERKHRVHPALNFCPPVHVKYFRDHLAHHSPPLPDDYWMLDAPAILATIHQKTQLSMWLVNLGANPSSTAEDGDRRVINGDDCSPLWPMGYHGVNFDIARNEQTTMAFYKSWPNAIVDLDGAPPPSIVSKLVHHGVPKDIDFLKIDVDSFDCEFLSHILNAGYAPKAMSLELAAPWPPPLKFMVKYSSNFSYAASTGTVMSGCSLQMGMDLAKPHGYTLLQYAMEDGWFVKDEYLDLFGGVERDIVKVYDNGNPNRYASFAWQRHADMVKELEELRNEPDEMLKKAQRGVQQVLGAKPELATAKYVLEV
jgi:hypothetical protein